MFLNHSSYPPGCSNRLFGSEENDLEVMRLKMLFQENILKVEKENMEIIKKNMSDAKQLPKKETNPKRVVGSNKRPVYKKLSENKNEIEQRLPSIQPEAVCHNRSPDCRFSAIHFLNHFESSFLSSKVPNADILSGGKYMPCAVSLAPPNQQRSSILDERLQVNNKARLSSNVVLHHVIPEEAPKKLMVQVLPSITIHGTKSRRQPNISNVVTEVVKKKDYYEGDGIKTTILPEISDEDRHRISSINLNSKNFVKSSIPEEKKKLSDAIQVTKPAFTQTSCETIAVPNLIAEKERLKEIVKEIMKDFPVQYQGSHNGTNPKSITKKEDAFSQLNDCELDSFLGNMDFSPRLSSNITNEKVSKSSSQIQPSHDIPEGSFNRKQMEDLIEEVILKLQHDPFSQLSFTNNEEKAKEKIQKDNKGVQTYAKDCEKIQDVRSSVPKAIQVTFREDPFAKCDSAATEAVENSVQNVTESRVHGETVNKLSEGEFTSKPIEDSSKLESVLNTIYERFCMDRITTPQPVGSRESVATREVSVQINPIATVTKGTCTSDVMRVDANQQCTLLPVMQPEKHVSHTSVQAELVTLEPNPILSAKPTAYAYVQCEQPALIDSGVQTMEHLKVFNPSESSANTSVSTTPVSDSMFVDDMLSEGEVPYKVGTQASRNGTDASLCSDRENDYSLSEGEIHPKYLQQMHLHQFSSGDSYIDKSTSNYPQYPTILLGRSPGEINPESKSYSAGEPSFYSSSSLSEGEVRSCSTTPLSEGEVPFYFRQSHRPSTSQSFSGSWRDMIQNPSFRYPLSSHRLDSSFESNSRTLYNLGVSEDEYIPLVNEAPLHTVTEEK